MTFSLTGFSTIKREGIELTSGFAAKIDAEMRVGALEETLTVTGQSPVVDVQNTSQLKVVSSEMLFALPLTKEMGGLAKVTVGVMIPPTAQDVGGNIDPMNAYPVIHGGHTSDNRALLDGMQFNGEGQGRGFYFNPAAAQEASVQLGGQTAEFENGGFQANMIPKDGGNLLLGTLQRQLRQRQAGQRQPDARSCSTAGLHAGQHDQAHLRRQRGDRRSDLQGQAVVLHVASRVRLPELSGRQLLQLDAEHAVLHARSEPARHPPAGQLLRRRPLHLSGVVEGQDQRRPGTSSTRTSAWAAARWSRRKRPT